MDKQLQGEQEKLAGIVSIERFLAKFYKDLTFLVNLKEAEINKIQSLIGNIKQGNLSEESEELAKLLTENSKLKLRLDVLNRVSVAFVSRDLSSQ
jgi:hypothetical protein